MDELKERPPKQGATRVGSKRRVTIPARAFRAAGLGVGDWLVARADGPGRIVLERARDVLDEYAGLLTGTYDSDELETLRSEWASRQSTLES